MIANDARMQVAKQAAENLLKLRIEHQKYEAATNELYAQLTMSPPGSVIVLIGPSRAGKTEVAKRVMSYLSPPDDASPNLSAWTEAVISEGSKFVPKDMYLRILHVLRHPFHHIPEGINNEDSQLYRRNYSRSEPIERKLRLAVEAAMRSRHIEFLFVDEAHHIANAASKHTAQRQLDGLKSLGNTTAAKSVWIAGYDFLKHGLLSPHLLERMTFIHFSRYQQNEQDLTEFADVLQQLSPYLPMKEDDGLLHFIDDLYEGTQGVVGSTLTWTLRALSAHAVSNNRYLSFQHFSKTRLRAQQRSHHKDIFAGEQLIEDFSVLPNRQPTQPTAEPCKSTKPFSRNPKRTRVGR